MIIINNEHKFDFDSTYTDVHLKIEKYVSLLTNLNKPFIKQIANAIKKGNIKVMYNSDNTDYRVLVPSKDKKKVFVNISNITKDLDKTIDKGNLDLSLLYSYLVQAYGLLEYKDIFKNRQIINTALDTYYEVMVKALTMKGIGVFRNEQEKSILRFLLYCYILKKSDTPVGDHIEYAARVSKIDDGNAEYVYDKFKDLLEKEIQLDKFIKEVLAVQFPFMKKIDGPGYIVLMISRAFGITAASMIDDLSFFIPIALDFIQTTKPVVYKNYGGLVSVVKKTAYKDIFEALLDN